jgi:geranylgeranyl reductase family protein
LTPVQLVDVLVVGAGPAGSAAAVELARHGREVVVVDKATFPRDKCCGDGLTTGALRHLDQLGLDPRDVASWLPINGCRVRSPSGRTIDLPFPTTGPTPGVFGAVARRTDLDAALVDLARARGAKILEGHGFTGLTANTDGVTVSLEGQEPIAARYVIAADGMWSSVRKAVGANDEGYLGEWHAFRQYIRAPGEGARHLWVWFEPSLLPGYAWSFPLPDQTANVGFGIRRQRGEPARSMADAWRALLQEPHIREVLGESAEPEAPHKAWPIPARLPTTRLDACGGRVLFVGDAARATDPMTGEGIGQALETGRLAATVIAQAGPHRPGTAAARYTTTLKCGMAIDHRLADLLSHALASTKGARGAVRIAGANAWTRRNFARWLFEDYPRAVVATPHRWASVTWKGHGAFGAD